jgi:hypothetical protein
MRVFATGFGALGSSPPSNLSQFWSLATEKSCHMGERPLHTGEVVGSIPTAPTSDFPINQRLCAFIRAGNSQLAAERRRNMHRIAGENPGNLFFTCSRFAKDRRKLLDSRCDRHTTVVPVCAASFPSERVTCFVVMTLELLCVSTLRFIGWSQKVGHNHHGNHISGCIRAWS